MSTFTLAISYVTTSNLPWFMDLTFQVPMQYCSLQHRILLLSPVPSTTGCCFRFGSFSSLLLELFLHWFPVAYWAPTKLGSSSLSVLSFCLFILFMGFSRQEYWSGLPFPSPVDHVLSDSCESLGLKEILSVHAKGDQSWIFIGRTDAEAETPTLWPPDAKSWLIWKDPDAGKHWGQEEKGMTEDEMVGWHHWLNGHGFGWTRGVGDGQWGLACCSPWGCKELDMTEWLNWLKQFGNYFCYRFWFCFMLLCYSPKLILCFILSVFI